MSLTLINDKVVDSKKAMIPSDCVGFTLAGSVFEAMRINWNENRKIYVIPNYKNHIKRLRNSLKIMRMNLEKTDLEIENDIRTLIVAWINQNSDHHDGYIRMTAYISNSSTSGSVCFPDDLKTDLIISIKNSDWKKSISNNITCCVSSWQRISDNSIPPRVKSAANYENTRLAGQEALLNGYDNAILLNQYGCISEAAESSVFYIDQNDNLITPRVEDDVLESLNRRLIIKIWHEMTGKPVLEKKISRTDLYVAKEVFLCNTAKLIRTVRSIDHYLIEGDSTYSEKISNIYSKVLRGEIEYEEDSILQIKGDDLI